jgi:hypothetical protein
MIVFTSLFWANRDAFTVDQEVTATVAMWKVRRKAQNIEEKKTRLIIRSLEKRNVRDLEVNHQVVNLASLNFLVLQTETELEIVCLHLQGGVGVGMIVSGLNLEAKIELVVGTKVEKVPGITSMIPTEILIESVTIKEIKIEMEIGTEVGTKLVIEIAGKIVRKIVRKIVMETETVFEIVFEIVKVTWKRKEAIVRKDTRKKNI